MMIKQCDSAHAEGREGTFRKRELAGDRVRRLTSRCCAFSQLSTQVPPWDFREEVGLQRKRSQQKECHSGRCCYDGQCEAKFESFKALAICIAAFTTTNGRCPDLNQE